MKSTDINIVTFGIYPISIENPTTYIPDEVIKRYMQKNNTYAAPEIQIRVNNYMPVGMAAKNLFVRAVRSEESAKYKSFFVLAIVGFITISPLNFSAMLSRVPVAIVSAIGSYFLYDLLVGITDQLGVKFQYSI